MRTHLYSLHLSHFLPRHLPFRAQDNVSLALSKLIRNLYKPKTPGKIEQHWMLDIASLFTFARVLKDIFQYSSDCSPEIFWARQRWKHNTHIFPPIDERGWIVVVGTMDVPVRDNIDATIITATLNGSNCSIHITCNAAPDIRIMVVAWT